MKSKVSLYRSGSFRPGLRGTADPPEEPVVGKAENLLQHHGEHDPENEQALLRGGLLLAAGLYGYEPHKRG